MKRLILFAILLAGCGEQSTSYFKIAGGGLQFNLGSAQATMIVVAQQVSPPPDGSTLEAQFDIPGTNTRQSLSEPITNDRLQYKFQTKPLTGLVKDAQYHVSILVHDKDGKVIDQKDTVFTSDEDQSTLPTKP